MPQTKCHRRVQGRLITSSWTPHRRRNLSWDGRAGWLKFETVTRARHSRKVYPFTHGVSTVVAYCDAWHRGGPQEVFLFWCEVAARLSWALGKSDGDCFWDSGQSSLEKANGKLGVGLERWLYVPENSNLNCRVEQRSSRRCWWTGFYD